MNIALTTKKINNQNNIKKKRSDLYNKRVESGEKRPALRTMLIKIGNDDEIEDVKELEQLKNEQTLKIFMEFINAKFTLKDTSQELK